MNYKEIFVAIINLADTEFSRARTFYPLFPLSSALLAVVTNSGRINANDYFQKGIALIIWEVIMSGKWFGLRINE